RLGHPDHPLDNLAVIVDYNKIQLDDFVSKVLDLEPVVSKWQAFGWPVIEIDGHDMAQIDKALDQAQATKGTPTLVVAHTVKGKGVSFMELGAKAGRIVTLDADLSKSTMTAGFAKQFPGRAFNLGIAESNMVGIAAGLALTGRVPFACSFACFIVGRFETIRISVAYTNANVKIVGTH